MRLGPALVRWTGRAEGDMCGHPVARERAVVDRPWSWVRQVHGADVLVVTEPGGGGDDADALVSARPDVALSIRTADCAPIALASPEGVIGAVHAGWRGLEAGVVERAAGAMRELGATEIVGALGPCIGPECYEFGAGDLTRLGATLGAGVQSRTAGGAPALDLAAGVRAAAAAAGVALVHEAGVCTACGDGYYSHRARGEAERQAMVVWVDTADA